MLKPKFMNIIESNDALSESTKLSKTTLSVRHITKGGKRVKEWTYVHSVVGITRLDKGRREPVFICLEQYNRYSCCIQWR